MDIKSNLLSIGKMSKFTGASIKSLRYYEQLGILKPAYTDPSSGYRYYDLDQHYLISIIMYCIELDIPLKDLSEFIDADGKINFRKFLAQGRKITENKIKTLTNGLNYLAKVEQQMDLSEKYSHGQIYLREIEEKYFHVQPCEKPPVEMDEQKLLDMFIDFATSISNIDEGGIDEYGFLYEYSPQGVHYHMFISIPKDHAAADAVKIIPGGTYPCTIGTFSRIKNTPDIFKKHLKNKRSFLAIETHIIASKFKITNPLSELRIVTS